MPAIRTGRRAPVAREPETSDTFRDTIKLRSRDSGTGEVAVHTVHRNFACRQSPFIERQVHRKRRHTKILVDLPDCPLAAFNIFCEFITKERFIGFQPGKGGGSDILVQLLEVYVFAEKVEAYQLCDFAIAKAAMVGKSQEGILMRPEMLGLLYRQTAKGSGIRAFVVDLWNFYTNADNKNFIDMDVARSATKEFLVDVIVAKAELAGGACQPAEKCRNPCINFVMKKYVHPAPISIMDDGSSSEDEEIAPPNARGREQTTSSLFVHRSDSPGNRERSEVVDLTTN